MSTWQGIHGLVAANVPLNRFAPDLGAPRAHPTADWWTRMRESGASWVKFGADTHTADDAAVARGWGLRVILRMASESLVHHEDVLAAITRYGGVVDYVECGNEPVVTGLAGWQHAFYLEDVVLRCQAAAHAAGIQLCTPGWPAGTLPPGPMSDGLGQRLAAVYSGFDVIGVHAYAANTLATPDQRARLVAWQAAWGKPILCTEYGIADRVLPGAADEGVSDLLKVQRYADWLGTLATVPGLLGACCFLGGGNNSPGVNTWAAFNDASGGYSAAGKNRYWLSEAAWQEFGHLAAA